MKNLKKLLYAMACFLMVLTVTTNPLKADAATLKGTCEPVYKAAQNAIIFTVSFDSKVEIELTNSKGKVIDTKVCSSSAYFGDVTKNKIYFYRVRAVEYDRATEKYVGTTKWSAKKAICTANYSVTLVSKEKRIVRFKFPKVTGVKSYTLYMSTDSLTSGFKKVKTIAPGKTFTTSTFGGSTFQYYKNYYYKIVANLKNGTSAYKYTNGFYLYKTYG